MFGSGSIICSLSLSLRLHSTALVCTASGFGYDQWFLLRVQSTVSSSAMWATRALYFDMGCYLQPVLCPGAANNTFSAPRSICSPFFSNPGVVNRSLLLGRILYLLLAFGFVGAYSLNNIFLFWLIFPSL